MRVLSRMDVPTALHAAIALGLGIVLAGGGCAGPEAGADAGTADTTAQAPVDSMLDQAEALRRFRADLPQATELSNGAASREELVRAFLTAVERHDTAAFNRLLLSRAEFAWLYYPTAREALPPYQLAPDVMWFTQQARNEKDLSQLLSEAGGEPISYVGHACGEPRREGANLIHGACVLRRVVGTDTIAERWVGLIVERNGRFKFATYGNKVG